jgi:hypothetical protein
VSVNTTGTFLVSHDPEAKTSGFETVMQRVALAIGARSDADLARALGISTGDYSQRKGRSRVPWDRVIRLADSRSVSADWLLTGEGEMLRHRDGAECRGQDGAARGGDEGIAEPAASYAARIKTALALLADAQQLLSGELPADAAGTAGEARVTPDERALLACWRDLGPRQRRIVADLLRELWPHTRSPIPDSSDDTDPN